MSSTKYQAGTTREVAGKLAGGQLVEAITLRNSQGMAARILSFGATLQSLFVPDRAGKVADVVLGFDELADYVDKVGFFGSTIGRYANRIGGGKFMLDGKEVRIQQNEGENTLHGGTPGFDRVPWQVVSVSQQGMPKAVFKYVSPDGESGFPGELTVTTTYSLDDDNNLTIEFFATTTKPTVVNLTNHAYFNLAGAGSPLGATVAKLMIVASQYTPVRDDSIPTGEIRSVANTPFDFRQPRVIADALRDGRDEQIRIARGYDHNFVLHKGVTVEPELAARLEDAASGRVLEVLTTEPGLQFYSGNYFSGSRAGKYGVIYRMGDGVAFEPQKFPDAPNQPKFVSARIDSSKPYRHVMIYRFPR
jgi:aldose 1-epimerase